MSLDNLYERSHLCRRGLCGERIEGVTKGDKVSRVVLTEPNISEDYIAATFRAEK